VLRDHEGDVWDGASSTDITSDYPTPAGTLTAHLAVSNVTSMYFKVIQPPSTRTIHVPYHSCM
jgi:hypothetical protein